MPSFDLWTAMPILFPAGWALLLLLFTPAFREDVRWLWGCAVLGMALYLLVPPWILLEIGDLGDLRETAGLAGLPMIRTDRLSLWLDLIFAAAGLGTLLLLPQHLDRARAHRPEVAPMAKMTAGDEETKSGRWCSTRPKTSSPTGSPWWSVRALTPAISATWCTVYTITLR